MEAHHAISQLNDLELAILVCLTAGEHCIIRTSDHLLDRAQKGLEDCVSSVFNLVSVSLRYGTDDDFNVLGHALSEKTTMYYMAPDSSGQTLQSQVNVVIARDLNHAPGRVQIEALEFIRSRSLVQEDKVLVLQPPFLFVALISDDAAGPPFFTPHLNDHFFILHDISELSPSASAKAPQRPAFISANSTTSVASFSSIIVRRQFQQPADWTQPDRPLITHAMLTDLKASAAKVKTTAEVRRYIHNVVTFLRLHRAVAGGVSAVGTRQLNVLTRLNYIPPSLVSLAVRKVFAHRIVIATPETERSMQWGSDREAVEEALHGMTPERVIEEVLASVEVPL